MINQFSFIFLFCLNKIATPIPAPLHRPAIILPNVSPPTIYNCTNKTEIAQLGINPSAVEMNGWIHIFTFKVFVSTSSPIKWIIKPKAKLIIKIYKIVLNALTNAVASVNGNELVDCLSEDDKKETKKETKKEVKETKKVEEKKKS